MAECRIQGVFAQPSLVDAHRRLLAAALKDERNSMFVLGSESCIPLYHPALFWTQRQSESHLSRMGDGLFGVSRWSPKMATKQLLPGHFRKNAHWSSLTRMHAMIAAYDEHVWPQFKAFCRTLVRFCASFFRRFDRAQPRRSPGCPFLPLAKLTGATALAGALPAL